MSLSSLRNYLSGSDVSDEEENLSDSSPDIDSSVNKRLEGPQRTSNFFEVGDDETSSEEEMVEENPMEIINPTENRTKLPSAISALNTASSASSIFCNPFREAEEAEFNLLEQHVKLSERKKNEKPVKKSRLVCKMFRKGRCKMGDQCRFSHVIGSALLARLVDPSTESETQEREQSPPPNAFESAPVRYNAREEIVEEQPKKKRHIGVTNSLVPPKKAMKLFDEQLKSESPWLYKS